MAKDKTVAQDTTQDTTAAPALNVSALLKPSRSSAGGAGFVSCRLLLRQDGVNGKSGRPLTKPFPYSSTQGWDALVNHPQGPVARVRSIFGTNKIQVVKGSEIRVGSVYFTLEDITPDRLGKVEGGYLALRGS
jgi:hypothetical protein